MRHSALGPLAADSNIEFRAFLGRFEIWSKSGLNIRNVRLTSGFNGEVGVVKAAQCSSINGAMAPDSRNVGFGMSNLGRGKADLAWTSSKYRE
jgi:hypothetical protein